MTGNDTYIGNAKMNTDSKEVTGKLVTFQNEAYYKIANADAIRPFFMSIVSASNHWMFISSNGGLSAGRKDSNHSLFPYYTDDKITESAAITGSKTIVQLHQEDGVLLWEPFLENHAGRYKITRNLYKNTLGNKLVFEEINEDLKLIFQYHWNTSSQYGFVKKASLYNFNEHSIIATVLDGIQNIMPYGVPSAVQNASSNLVDAYKRNEMDAQTGLGIFALSAIIVDKAEPSEALKATTVWSKGLEGEYLVSSQQLGAFRQGLPWHGETDVKAEKGAYFVGGDVALKPKTEKNWMFVAEVNQSKVDVVHINKQLKLNSSEIQKWVEKDIEEGSKQLLELNAASDAIQLTADALRDTRHFSNTLFNIMRGGIFDDNYNIELSDFHTYLQKANTNVFWEMATELPSYPEVFSFGFLKDKTKENNNPDFKRLALEYMPLKFSRRHGDPSRPWNKFSINTETEDGQKVLDYEGNWRDIFQNWEALAHSYPVFIESMIFKFVNASTFDGYNPYRVTKDGFDWEIIEPDDPWSYIGYWGDHQIIYLLKFLEFIENHYPKTLATYFKEDIFVYANVPYKIKDYQAILENPKDTIVFDGELDARIHKERSVLGADAALLRTKDGQIYKVNLLEKLLASVLAKLTNFIPEGGIWMNTQRPEWNDANNALVGNGVSMVTLYYLRRFFRFFENVITACPDEQFNISEELAECFKGVAKVLDSHKTILQGKIEDTSRKTIVDGLGNAGSNYREGIYATGFSGKKSTLLKEELNGFIQLTLDYLEHSIKANKRTDSLYHAYNLMTLSNGQEVAISHLSEMLEGQVSVLSSGYLSGGEALQVLDGLKNSALFRHDQYSYILYPNKELPSFFEKNNIHKERLQHLRLVDELLQNGNSSILEIDADGTYHFNGNFNNANSLMEALDALPEEYKDLVAQDRTMLLEVFEETFDHKSFTGRSGTFFGYEGLGSIYWHMVSKLLLAVQETCLKAISENESAETVGRLLEHYYEINEGIGVHKSPELYGAFPTDPYSHTPAGRGAQQPGMTGQVKEDILCRFGELGVFVTSGQLYFNPVLLRRDEFLDTPKPFSYTDVNKEIKTIDLNVESLAFTYCQVPIIYQLATTEGLEVVDEKGDTRQISGLILSKETSSAIFKRTGEIKRVVVSLLK